MPHYVENLNLDILRLCREQIGLTLEAANKKHAFAEEAEEGTKPLTFRQLDQLADLYNVPRWVFLQEELPAKYAYNTLPAFRRFTGSTDQDDDYNARSIAVRVGQLRELMIDLQQDLGRPVQHFQPPVSGLGKSPAESAAAVRKWLDVDDKALEFRGWREKLEEKNIFIFMTSKYRGWSHMQSSLRGMSIYDSLLPVIIINDSDTRKAQSFTLFHELGHLLRKESGIDSQTHNNENAEKWCDEFAGCVLMPEEQIRRRYSTEPGSDISVPELKDVDKLARSFKASSYACLVRLHQLRIISRDVYTGLESELVNRYKNHQKTKKGSAPRNRPGEILQQYGRPLLRALVSAHEEEDIGLHKLCRILSLNNLSHADRVIEQMRDKKIGPEPR